MISRTTRNILRHRHLYSTATEVAPPASPPTPLREAWLYVDSVFPIQIARWDIRHYIGMIRSETLLTTLQSRLQSVTTRDFRVLELDPQQKDGGVFVKFSYTPDAEEQDEEVLAEIESALREEGSKKGGLPSWSGLRGGNVWLVKGTPWREDMNRFASPILQIAFEGPDVHEQLLYQLCRPYGRISDLTLPAPVPAGTLRSSIVTFRHLHAATIARNVIHGVNFPANPSTADTKSVTRTRLRASYQKPIQAHAIRDWMSSHPKIMLPLIVFLLGTLTYTIFDPIRALMVEGKLLDWFDYRKFKLYKWLRVNAIDRLSITFRGNSTSGEAPPAEVWRERKDAEAAMKSYLADMPTTIAFVHGPQGSGKTRMLEAILKESGRNALMIDCRELHKATSDSQLVGALASQTGYWPVFTFLNSMNTLIDLASVGLIGQKTGMSSSLSDQLQQILNVVATALKGVSSAHRAETQRQIRQHEQSDTIRADEERKREQLKRGTWHDGRLDCVAGNGIMSELGIGDEVIDNGEVIIASATQEEQWEKEERERQEKEAGRRQKTKEDMEAVNSLPIVVIRNFAAKVGGNKEELLTVLAQWAAMLAENQIAHVIVISDNRENAKRLANALPSKPLNSISLSDADAASSLSFVKQKLHDAGIDVGFTAEETKYVERLGGRASDLESLIHKVQSGQTVQEAVEDIIHRSVGELRKNAFGDDVDDAKNLPWTREQAWKVLRLLSEKIEAPYYDVLLDFPFKGDEAPLRHMEHAELITIGMHNGRPASIRPGKPVFKWVFERLVNDKIFQATQDIAFNEKLIASAESTVRTCEEELKALKGMMGAEPRHWWDWIVGRRSACRERAKYVCEKMLASEKKMEGLERKNAELKKVLAKGG
ncbi:RNA12 protein-domain-containing protein [Crucibulum laeve]|uniref:Mitochondrial escape protein 2 n=1 Tax=Crucibulum laeve TaxID=68775 RepID=A0A5C3MBU1_9AGAR|nr:RNA12 protein-domain-containing protein [Crucibulum laeve]